MSIKTLFSKITIASLLSLFSVTAFIYLFGYTFVSLVLTLFVLAGFMLFIKRLLHPLHCLIDVCHKRSLGLDDSSVCPGSTEVMELSSAINGLMQSHQHMCDQKQDIFKEAAHELKSPIAILKARLSLFEQDKHSDKKLFIKESQADIQNITIKLKELLFLKEVEWDMHQSKEHFNIQDQCDVMRAVFAPILEKKGLTMINGSSEDFALYVHKRALGKVMQAVFENIFYHTKNNTIIETRVSAKDRSLTVINTIGAKSDETLFSSAIGMRIIQRIASKLHYSYMAEKKGDTYVTCISFENVSRLD